MKKPRISATCLAALVVLLATVGGAEAEVIGIEDFAYLDGPTEGEDGGLYFDLSQATGHTGTSAVWQAILGAANHAEGELVTRDSGMLRDYHPDQNAGEIQATGAIYYKFDMTRQSGASWGGVSSFDFGSERVFFGVPGTGEATDTIGIGWSGTDTTLGSSTVADGSTHTLVGVVDFVAQELRLYLDPDLMVAEALNTPDAVRTNYNATDGSTSVRLASGGSGPVHWDNLVAATSWEDLSFDTIDQEPDGLPDWYEMANGLDTNVNDSADDPDVDFSSNLDELGKNTDPQNNDTDGDTLLDGYETHTGVYVNSTNTGTRANNIDTDGDGLGDQAEDNGGVFVSASMTGTDPNDPDSDNDDYPDGVEVFGGSDPNDDQDIPNPGDLDFIGLDAFDYADRPAVDLDGGESFDFDNTRDRDLFLGHTLSTSDWDTMFGDARIECGRLVTRDSGAKRELNGPSEGAGQNSDEREGLFSYDELFDPFLNPDGMVNLDTVWVRFDITRREGASWSGGSVFDYGAERYFIGVPFDANPDSGNREFGIDQSDQPIDFDAYTGISPSEDMTYTIVAWLDFYHGEIGMLVNPDLTGAQPEAFDASVAVVNTSNFDMTGWRFGSGGSGQTEWDNLVVATSWEGVKTPPTDTDGDGLRDAWEMLHGGDPTSLVAAADLEPDGLTNLQEQEMGTDPTSADTDADGYADGVETDTGIFVSISNTGTSPCRADTDGDNLLDGVETGSGILVDETDTGTSPFRADTDEDGALDGDEVLFGSDPNRAEDDFRGNLFAIGCEDFESYTDGASIGDGVGGLGFDLDLLRDPTGPEGDLFSGHTGTTADWDVNFGAAPTVNGGALHTMEGGALRQYNGPTEGWQDGRDERQCAVRDTGSVYYRVDMTRRTGATWSGFGSFDFGTERSYFGLQAGSNVFAVTASGEINPTAYSTVVALDDVTYTLVGVHSFEDNELRLYVDPDLTLAESNNTPVATREYQPGWWSTGVRLASGGSGYTEWDNLRVTREWDLLDACVIEPPVEVRITGIRLDGTAIAVDVEGLSMDEDYHVQEANADVTGWTAVSGTGFTATNDAESLRLDPVMDGGLWRFGEGPEAP